MSRDAAAAPATAGRPSRLRQAGYYLRFAWRTFALRRPLPVVGGLSVTDVCNLDCRHCWRKNTGRGHLPWSRIGEVLRDFHSMGVRYLYIQGGEPFTWRDGEQGLRSVVRLAKETGFFHVAVCTNGTFPLDAGPDTYWVSLDGAAATHDRIRGATFERIVANVRRSGHPHVAANVTINSQNAAGLRELADFVAAAGCFRGLMVNFHIPYPGVESLALPAGERMRVALAAAELKRRGYPIINSASGLRALGRNDWPRPLPFSVVSDGRETYRCCRAFGREDICRQCGYAVWAELSRIVRPQLMETAGLLSRLHSWRTA